MCSGVCVVSPPQKIPPNFVSAAELDVPGHMIKDRYKTILPSQCPPSSWSHCRHPPHCRPSCLSLSFVVHCLDPESRVILRSPEEEAGPDRYINANYIRVSRVSCFSCRVLFWWETIACSCESANYTDYKERYVRTYQHTELNTGQKLVDT